MLSYLRAHQAHCKWGDGGALAPQFFAKQLTLSQPGWQIMPTTVIQAPPRIFRPCDGPAYKNGVEKLIPHQINFLGLEVSCHVLKLSKLERFYMS